MFNWSPLFGRKAARSHPRRTAASAIRLRTEYGALAARHLQQIGIPEDCVDLDVGITSQDGVRAVCNVKIRVIRWDRNTGIRLLVSLPALEARMRKAVANSSLASVSDFGGIWVHASSQLPAVEVERDSEWAISELQAFETQSETAADRLRREMRVRAPAGTPG
jgi:hypothetical protein